MKKITLFVFVFVFLAFTLSAISQHSFPAVAGPTNVASGTPVTLNINDTGNSAAAPASSTGSYGSFSVSVDWVAGVGNPWSNEAEVTVNTTGSSVYFDTATTGSGSSGAATALTFEGDFTTPYNPTTDGALDLILDQDYGGSDADWSNLVVTIFESPLCFEPIGLTVGGLAPTSADISWTPVGTETSWEVAVQPQGTGEPTGSGMATSDNPYTAMGLTAATDYEVYVRANCLTDGFSTWFGPVNFTTACDIFIPDYLQDFATIIPNCWDEADNGDATTGPTDLGAGSWTADGYLNDGFDGAYKINLYSDFHSDWILSPQFDLTGGPFQVDFDFAIMIWNSTTNAGTLGSDDTVQLFISTDNGTTWTSLITFDNASVIPPTGTQVVYNLSAYSGQTVQFAILGSDGTVNDPEDIDVFVDNFRVRVVPTCPEPTGVVATIDGTSVDFSWTIGDSETAWEVVNQPAGTGVPTGNGTAVTTNAHSETGLTEGADYEFYVRANCEANGFSSWVGPYTYSIAGPGETCENPIIVTLPLPYVTTDDTANYLDDYSGSPGTDCGSESSYLGGDDVVYAYTPDADTSVDIDLSNVSNWAGLFVYTDCADIGTQCFNGGVNGFAGGDISLQEVLVTAGTTYYIVVSTYPSPQSTEYTLIISENTCINQTVDFLVVDDCDNGEQFLVDVVVTSFGDASSLVITDNQGATPVTVTPTSETQQFGPYPFLTDIIITVENADDSNCIVNSEAIQLLACPPDNDNPCSATVAVVNDSESCDQVTSGTIVSATDSGVPTGTCGGSPDDDVWFEFVALDDVQLISIINIQGSTTNLDHAVYEGTCDALVELYCSSDAASVTTQLTIGNTYYVRVFSGFTSDETSTFDLCIKEALDNIICENASNFCSDGEALYGANIIGIPDATEVACLGTIPNPSWNTIQIGESGPIEIEIVQNTEFDDAGNPIGTGLDVDFVLWGPFDDDTDFCELDLLVECPTCPFSNIPDNGFYPFGDIVDCSYSPAPIETVTIDYALEGEIYVLLVTNFSNQPGVFQIQHTNATDSGAGGITAEIEVDLGPDQDLCGFPDYTIVAESPYADTYEWYKNGIYLPDVTGDSFTVTESDNYTVIVYNEQCDVFAQDDVTINFYQDANANPVDDMVTCDDASADEVEDFDLETQTATILGDQSADDFAVTYYESLDDAQAGTNALTSPYDNTSNPQTIYYRIEDVDAVGTTSGCFATSNFDLVISGPLPTATSVNYPLCDDYSRDGVESFDLDSHSVNILDGQDDTMFTVSYYLTEADAESGTDPLVSPYDNISNPQTVYARVENNTAFDCYTITGFDLVVEDVPYTTFNSSVIYEVCPPPYNEIPIEVMATAENYTESDVTINWYNEGVLVPEENSLVLPVYTQGTYTIEVISNSGLGCDYEEDVIVLEYESCVIPQVITPNGDEFNNEFDLSSYDVHRLEIYNRNGKLVYSKDNYSNEWVGQTDAGDKLPVGTYFYVMQYQDNKDKTGWIYLNY